MSENQVKNRSKSTGVKRCLVISRVDSVPEKRFNVKVIIDRINLPELQKEFCVIGDLKLIDLMVGIQSTAVCIPVHIAKVVNLTEAAAQPIKKEVGSKGNSVQEKA